jgi:recombination protein RecA
MAVRSLLRGAARAFAMRPQSVPRRSYAPEAVLARALANEDLDSLAQRPVENGADTAITSVDRAHGESRTANVRNLTVAESKHPNVLSTGTIGLDLALGIGGLPMGAVVHVSGAPGTGKTTLALHAIAEAQRHGRHVGFIDLSRNYNPEYASQVGVDVEELVVLRPADLRDALEAANKFIESEGLDLLVFDSGGLVLGAGALGTSEFVRSWRTLRKLRNELAHSHSTAVFIQDFQRQTEATGKALTQYKRALDAYNRTWNTYSSVRLNLEALQSVRDAANATRRRSRITIEKNELSSVLGEAEIEIVEGRGIDREADLVDKALERSLIVKGDFGLEFEGVKLGSDRDAAVEFLRHQADVSARIVQSLLPRV